MLWNQSATSCIHAPLSPLRNEQLNSRRCYFVPWTIAAASSARKINQLLAAVIWNFPGRWSEEVENKHATQYTNESTQKRQKTTIFHCCLNCDLTATTLFSFAESPWQSSEWLEGSCSLLLTRIYLKSVFKSCESLGQWFRDIVIHKQRVSSTHFPKNWKSMVQNEKRFIFLWKITQRY